MRVLTEKADPLAQPAATGSEATRLQERLAELRRLRGRGVPDFTSRVRKLVVVASSSRGGSSMVTELLRHSSALVHLRAELNPFLRLVGLGSADSGTGCDLLQARHLRALDLEARLMLDQELALDAGTLGTSIDDEEQFALDVAWRLTIQWPSVAIDPERYVTLIRDVLHRMRQQHAWAPRELPDHDRFQLGVLHALRAAHPQVNPWYHDLPKTLLLNQAGVPAPQGAPGHDIIEEPPFILPRVWRRADASDLATKPLVIKTPSNAYRMDFLHALFPNAQVMVLHLTRNPAASINGLYDGWRYPGFHAYRVAEPLRIPGYADELPGERWWWKFDLPPAWEEFTDAPLMQVCAFQWLSCHRAILSDASAGRSDYLRVGFEDFVRGPERRLAAVQQVAEWLGVPVDAALRRAALDGVDPVVTTSPPAARRWRARTQEILPVINETVREVAGELGYGSDASWI